MRLRAVLERHQEAIEADFQETYGVHIGLLGTEALTYRRFGVLLSQLPVTSRTKRQIIGPAADWDNKDRRLADLVDSVQFLIWQHARSHWKGVSRKPPKPLRRPGDDGNAQRPGVSERKFKGVALPMSKLRALTERWRNGGGDPDG